MSRTNMKNDPAVTRRQFVKSSAAIATATPFAGAMLASGVHASVDETIHIGLIGCGGRGTGAAFNALEASPNTQIVALADLFEDRLRGCRDNLASNRGDRGTVAEDRCYTGFDAYKQLLNNADIDIDMVILATPPHFRPAMIEASVNAGKHIFTEKPVAVDPAGIRKVLAAGKTADEKGLSIVAGTQRRHQGHYLTAMDMIHNGEFGDVIAARCYWNQGGLWVKEPRPEWSDMEWQIRNWLYFTWLSGDHIVEQHVHNLDVVNWAFGSHPVRAMGMGGRQVRTHENYGNIFDHFAIEYEYDNGAFNMSMCRQIDGCASRVDERIHCTNGAVLMSHGGARYTGGAGNGGGIKPRPGIHGNPYVQEHIDLLASIRGDTDRINESQHVAEATMTAILGRMSAYSGKAISWDDAMQMQDTLGPADYTFGPLPVNTVATPGKTTFR